MTAIVAVALIGGSYYLFNKSSLEKQAALTAALESAAKTAQELRAAQTRQLDALKALEEARAAEAKANAAGDPVALQKAQETARRALEDAARQAKLVKAQEEMAANARRRAQDAAQSTKASAKAEQVASAATTATSATPKSAESYKMEAPKKAEGKASPGEMSADSVVAAMKVGSIAFNVPSTMRLGDTEQLSLLLSLDRTVNELKAEVAAAGAKEGAEVKVSDRMQARLSGPSALGIVPVTPEEQLITSRGTAEWKWLMTPSAPGRYPMHLVLNALLTVQGKEGSHVVRSFERTIAVEVTWPQRLGELWQWLAAAAFTLSLAFWWRRRKRTETGRKLAALLSADVAGYSRLMQQDDQGTLRRLTESRTLFAATVAAHEGRIVNAPGDSILAEFPSVLEAVRAAIEVQEALAQRNASTPEDRRMLFRIGIDIGDVLMDDAGLYGDGVNISARLQALAEPGGICISQLVYEKVKSFREIAFDDIGEHKVKNFAEPLHVFTVRGAD